MAKLLMISTDRSIFDENSAVRARQIEYAKDWEEVHIIAFARRRAQDARRKMQDAIGKSISGNCWVYSTSSWTKIRYPFDAIRFGRLIVKERGITNITCQDASLTAMTGVSLKKKFGIPLEIQIHNDIGSPYFAFNISNKIRKFLAKKYIPQADSIRVVSNKIKEYLVKDLHIDNSKITVRPIAVDVEQIKNALIITGANLHEKYPQFGKIVLMASRLEAEKNIEMAITVWKDVVKKVPNAGLLIVGKGSERERLEKMVDALGLTSQVIFEDWVDRATLMSYYKTADLFLNTSLFEGYGMSLVEANAAGCSIISTDVGVAREVGTSIVGFDEKELATTLMRFLTEADNLK